MPTVEILCPTRGERGEISITHPKTGHCPVCGESGCQFRLSSKPTLEAEAIHVHCPSRQKLAEVSADRMLEEGDICPVCRRLKGSGAGQCSFKVVHNGPLSIRFVCMNGSVEDLVVQGGVPVHCPKCRRRIGDHPGQCRTIFVSVLELPEVEGNFLRGDGLLNVPEDTHGIYRT